MRTLAAITKVIVYILASLLLILIQNAILLFFRGKPASLVYPKIYHAQCCRIFGLKVLIEGEIEDDERVIYVGNHISYLDIPGLGSILNGCFVAKKEVSTWPVFGMLGSLGQTLYISRNPADAAKETDVLVNRLKDPLPLIIFPEGTSTDGTKVLPFKSSFFQIFLNQNLKIQPFTISILSIDEKPAATQAIRDLYAWHGDMTLLPHLWSFAKGKGGVIKVTFQKPLPTSSFDDRKLLCNACYDDVVKGLDLSHLAA